MLPAATNRNMNAFAANAMRPPMGMGGPPLPMGASPMRQGGQLPMGASPFRMGGMPPGASPFRMGGMPPGASPFRGGMGPDGASPFRQGAPLPPGADPARMDGGALTPSIGMGANPHREGIAQPSPDRMIGPGNLPPWRQGGGFAPPPDPMQQAAMMGRNGDSVLAHLTPGEISIPPELQNPQVLATLDNAFGQQGINRQQFTAGSPQSSVNPMTGLQEHNLMSSFLPAALGLAGSMIVPGLGLAISPMLAGALGGGAGTALGSLMAGQKPGQALLSGLGAGAGGYLLGGLGGAGTGAAGAGVGINPADASKAAMANSVGNQFRNGMNFSSNLASPVADSIAGSSLPGMGVAEAAAGGSAPGAMNLWGMLPRDINPLAAAGSTVGGMIGSSIGAPVKSLPAPRPPGFDENFPSMDQLPPWNQSIGQTSYKGPMPNYSGFDPLSFDPKVSTGYNFYPLPPQS